MGCLHSQPNERGQREEERRAQSQSTTPRSANVAAKTIDASGVASPPTLKGEGGPKALQRITCVDELLKQGYGHDGGLPMLSLAELSTLSQLPAPAIVLTCSYTADDAEEADLLLLSTVVVGAPAGHVAGGGAGARFHLSVDAAGDAGLELQMDRGMTSLHCALANAAALQGLGLDDEQAVLGFLARAFQSDRGLVSLFQDTVKRLLSGVLSPPTKHFVPGNFGRGRFFLSMRISPFVFRAGAPPAPAAAAAASGSAGGGVGDGIGGAGLIPALLLELDVPYEGCELAARLQRDYLVLSNIPSMVTIFDCSGQVLHQNNASVEYMGYLAGWNGLTPAAATSAAAGRPEPGAAVGGVGGGGATASGVYGAAERETPPMLLVSCLGSADASQAAAAAAAARRGSADWGPQPQLQPRRPRSHLERLFARDPGRLAEVLAAVAEGKEYRGLVQMSASWVAHDTGADADAAREEGKGTEVPSNGMRAQAAEARPRVRGDSHAVPQYPLSTAAIDESLITAPGSYPLSVAEPDYCGTVTAEEAYAPPAAPPPAAPPPAGACERSMTAGSNPLPPPPQRPSRPHSGDAPQAHQSASATRTSTNSSSALRQMRTTLMQQRAARLTARRRSEGAVAAASPGWPGASSAAVAASAPVTADAATVTIPLMSGARGVTPLDSAGRPVLTPQGSARGLSLPPARRSAAAQTSNLEVTSGTAAAAAAPPPAALPAAGVVVLAVSAAAAAVGACETADATASLPAITTTDPHRVSDPSYNSQPQQQQQAGLMRRSLHQPGEHLLTDVGEEDGEGSSGVVEAPPQPAVAPAAVPTGVHTADVACRSSGGGGGQSTRSNGGGSGSSTRRRRRLLMRVGGRASGSGGRRASSAGAVVRLPLHSQLSPGKPTGSGSAGVTAGGSSSGVPRMQHLPVAHVGGAPAPLQVPVRVLGPAGTGRPPLERAHRDGQVLVAALVDVGGGGGSSAAGGGGSHTAGGAAAAEAAAGTVDAVALTAGGAESVEVGFLLEMLPGVDTGVAHERQPAGLGSPPPPAALSMLTASSNTGVGSTTEAFTIELLSTGGPCVAASHAGGGGVGTMSLLMTARRSVRSAVLASNSASAASAHTSQADGMTRGSPLLAALRPGHGGDEGGGSGGAGRTGIVVLGAMDATTDGDSQQQARSQSQQPQVRVLEPPHRVPELPAAELSGQPTTAGGQSGGFTDDALADPSLPTRQLQQQSSSEVAYEGAPEGHRGSAGEKASSRGDGVGTTCGTTCPAALRSTPLQRAPWLQVGGAGGASGSPAAAAATGQLAGKGDAPGCSAAGSSGRLGRWGGQQPKHSPGAQVSPHGVDTLAASEGWSDPASTATASPATGRSWRLLRQRSSVRGWGAAADPGGAAAAAPAAAAAASSGSMSAVLGLVDRMCRRGGADTDLVVIGEGGGNSARNSGASSTPGPEVGDSTSVVDSASASEAVAVPPVSFMTSPHAAASACGAAGSDGGEDSTSRAQAVAGVVEAATGAAAPPHNSAAVPLGVSGNVNAISGTPTATGYTMQQPPSAGDVAAYMRASSSLHRAESGRGQDQPAGLTHLGGYLTPTVPLSTAGGHSGSNSAPLGAPPPQPQPRWSLTATPSRLAASRSMPLPSELSAGAASSSGPSQLAGTASAAPVAGGTRRLLAHMTSAFGNIGRGEPEPLGAHALGASSTLEAHSPAASAGASRPAGTAQPQPQLPSAAAAGLVRLRSVNEHSILEEQLPTGGPEQAQQRHQDTSQAALSTTGAAAGGAGEERLPVTPRGTQSAALPRLQPRSAQTWDQLQLQQLQQQHRQLQLQHRQPHSQGRQLQEQERALQGAGSARVASSGQLPSGAVLSSYLHHPHHPHHPPQPVQDPRTRIQPVLRTLLGGALAGTSAPRESQPPLSSAFTRRSAARSEYTTAAALSTAAFARRSKCSGASTSGLLRVGSGGGHAVSDAGASGGLPAALWLGRPAGGGGGGGGGGALHMSGHLRPLSPRVLLTARGSRGTLTGGGGALATAGGTAEAGLGLDGDVPTSASATTYTGGALSSVLPRWSGPSLADIPTDPAALMPPARQRQHQQQLRQPQQRRSGTDPPGAGNGSGSLLGTGPASMVALASPGPPPAAAGGLAGAPAVPASAPGSYHSRAGVRRQQGALWMTSTYTAGPSCSQSNAAMLGTGMGISPDAAGRAAAATAGMPPAAYGGGPSLAAAATFAGPGAAGLQGGGGGGVRWHEVVVKPVPDPMSGERLLLVVQTDVTCQVRAEELLGRVLEAEHRLLADVFPRHVVAHMTAARNLDVEARQAGLLLLRHIQDPRALATSHTCITILFADIKGFTEMSKEVSAAEVMSFLNDLYTRFDSLTDVYGVYKVETIGDCYMVAGGLVARDEDGFGAVRRHGDTDPLHAMRVVSFGRAMLEEAAKVALPGTGQPVRMRVGVHSGPATSGVVGQKMPRFCLFGDTVNTASRMESTGRPGCIHISAATRSLLPRGEDEASWVPTGGVEVKGKGVLSSFIWCAHSADASKRRRHRKQRAQLLATLPSSREEADAAARAAAAAGGTAGAAASTSGSNAVDAALVAARGSVDSCLSGKVASMPPHRNHTHTTAGAKPAAAALLTSMTQHPQLPTASAGGAGHPQPLGGSGASSPGGTLSSLPSPSFPSSFTTSQGLLAATPVAAPVAAADRKAAAAGAAGGAAGAAAAASTAATAAATTTAVGTRLINAAAAGSRAARPSPLKAVLTRSRLSANVRAADQAAAAAAADGAATATDAPLG